jgi:integrase
MSIRWDTRNKRWRYEFDRYIQGRRHRLSRLLPRGWSQSQADAYDRHESGRLYAVATGVQQGAEPLIDEAVVHYLRDKRELKSFRAAAEHLAAVAWAYTGKPMSALPEVARAIMANTAGVRPGTTIAPATVRQRISLLKAACRWAWKKHGLTDADPTGRMQMPSVRNERRTYLTRKGMLQACRACTLWEAQIAIRVAFYSGLRLGELWRVRVVEGVLLLDDSKNGQPRAVPAHPRIRHLLKHLPLTGKPHSVQVAWMRARDRVGLGDVRFHDLRHSAASEMVNAGVGLYTVGQVLGHKDQRSTQRYAHLTTATLAEAVNKIGRKKAG